MLKYICEMLSMITTGDEEQDAASIEVLADSVHSRAAAMHAEYVKHLENNNEELTKTLKNTNQNNGAVDSSS